VTIGKRQRSGVLDWFEADIPAYSGSRSSLDRAMLEPEGRSIWLVCWIGSCGRKLAM